MVFGLSIPARRGPALAAALALLVGHGPGCKKERQEVGELRSLGKQAVGFFYQHGQRQSVSGKACPAKRRLAGLDGAAIALADVTARLGVRHSYWTRFGDNNRDQTVPTFGGGVGMEDLDGDGLPDLLLTSGPAPDGSPGLRLLRNGGRAGFTDVTARSGIAISAWVMGLAVADVEGDGDRDIYVTTHGRNYLLINRGDGTFTDETDRRGVQDRRWSTAAVFWDYDRDGRLDLFVASYEDVSRVIPRMESMYRLQNRVFRSRNMPMPLFFAGLENRLFRQKSDGTFSDVTRVSGLLKRRRSLGAVALDYDRDGQLDLYVANDLDPNSLYRNNGDGTFSEVGRISNSDLGGDGRLQSSMGLSAADPDGDGDLDLVVTNYALEHNTLYENKGGGAFVDTTRCVGLREPSWSPLGWGVGMYDLDNDGLLDMFVANGQLFPDGQMKRWRAALARRTTLAGRGYAGHMTGHVPFVHGTYAQRNQVFRNLDGARFAEVTASALPGGLAPRVSRGAAFGDLDGDGDVDVVVLNYNAGARVLRNRSRGQGSWLKVRLRGRSGNRDGVGARVTVRGGGRLFVGQVVSGASYLSHDTLELEFGLGRLKVAERVEVAWPGGGVQTLEGVPVNRTLVIGEQG